MADNIIIFCAHNDDNLLGVGGTIARYASEGMNIVTVIFSYGESSHPWLKAKVTQDMRKKECEEANKVIGGNDIIYFGLKDSKLEEEVNKNKTKIENKIKEIIDKFKPKKIFTHAFSDPHPDHKAVTNALLHVLDKNKIKYDVYSYCVWDPIEMDKNKFPNLVVDISKHYGTKLKALKCHKSQKITMISLLWNVLRKDLFNGIKNHCRFAEVFYKIR